MAVTIQPLIQSQTLANSLAVYFTASAATRIDAMTLMNAGAATETVTIQWVPSGGAAATANIIAKITLLAGQSASVYQFIGQTMAAGDKIEALGATGGLVNLFASGTVST